MFYFKSMETDARRVNNWEAQGPRIANYNCLAAAQWADEAKAGRSSFRVWFVEAIPQALRLLAVGRKYWFKDNTWHSVCWELGANECVFVRGRRQIAVALCVSRAKVTQKHETQRCRF